MRPLGAGSLALALLGASCKVAEGPFASVCAEGLHDAGASDAGSGDAGPTDAGPTDAGPGDGGSACPTCQGPTSCGTAHDPGIVSVAGAGASAIHPRTFYVHNGPPDVARFFAVDETGADLGTFQVDGAVNLDWEDLAVGPCPGGSCVFLADIGDARQVRGQYTVYRVAEPLTLGGGTTTVEAEAFPFAYPDGSHDAAAILVHPQSRVVTVITRDHSGSGTLVYELPMAQPGQPVTAIPRGSIDHLGLGISVTAASVRKDGLVVVRTSKGVALFEPPAGDAGLEPLGSVLRTTPCVTAEASPGESIAWIASGGGYVTFDLGPAPALRYSFCAGLP